MSLLLALPGGGSAAVELTREPDPAVQAWWIARARRAQDIAVNHDAHIAEQIVGGT